MLPLALGGLLSPEVEFQFCVSQGSGDRSEAPSIRAEPRPSLSLCSSFPGQTCCVPIFRELPSLTQPTGELRHALPLDLGEPVKHIQASVLWWRFFYLGSFCGGSERPCTLQVASLRCTWCAELRGALGEGVCENGGGGEGSHSRATLEGRAKFLHCVADIAWGLKKKKSIWKPELTFLLPFFNLNSGTQIHKFHKCSCHALNCSFYLQTGFQSRLVAQWWGFYSLANLKGWGGIWKLFWHSAQEDYLNSIFRCVWYLHEAQSKNEKCVLYTYKYI